MRRIKGRTLAVMLAGRCWGAGVLTLAPWTRSTDQARPQDVQRGADRIRPYLPEADGTMPFSSAQLLQVAGFVYPGNTGWDAAGNHDLCLFPQGGDPVAIGLRWGRECHLVLLGRALTDESRWQMVCWVKQAPDIDWRHLHQVAPAHVHQPEIPWSEISAFCTETGFDAVCRWEIGIEDIHLALIAHKQRPEFSGRVRVHRILPKASRSPWFPVAARRLISPPADL